MTAKVEGEVLTITVDLAKNAGPSKTGNSYLVATSGGNQEVTGHPGCTFGAFVYRPPATDAEREACDKAAEQAAKKKARK